MVLNLSSRGKNWAFGGLGLVCFVSLLTLEIATEDDHLSLFDVLGDALSMLLTIGAAVGVAMVALRLQLQHEENLGLLRDLETARAQGNGWRNKMRRQLAGVRAGIDAQFQEWNMTRAEREIGLLLLKGLSHKEIATLRASTEDTVRQQAHSIYRKADLPGKTAFLAYFLGGLYEPDDEMDGQLMSFEDGLDWHSPRDEAEIS
jgi:DNA-binding CsgD family transcriptional regulator